MRDFFINSLEKLVSVLVALLGLVVLVAAGAASFGAGHMGQAGGPPGPLLGLMILIGGAIYVIFIGGFLYMGIGIYQNTKRAAEALERMAQR